MSAEDLMGNPKLGIPFETFQKNDATFKWTILMSCDASMRRIAARFSTAKEMIQGYYALNATVDLGNCYYSVLHIFTKA